MRRSGIRDVFDAAQARPDVIHLEVGEPSFPTPPHIVEAANRAAQQGKTRYTPNAGVEELRHALGEKVTKRNRFKVDGDNVIVTTGGIGAIYSAMLAVARYGDEVLIGDPGWPNYQMICDLQGLVSRHYPLSPDRRFQPDVSDLERLISQRTRVLLINTPCNPTGSVFSADVLGELYAFAQRHDLWIISDEVYDEVTFGIPHLSIATMDTDDRVITVFSFSKTHAMTGWRVGYAVATEAVAELIARVQEAITSCASAPAQAAALAATTGPQDHVEAMRFAYRERRDQVLEILDEFGLPAMRPDGAFYVWIDVSGSNIDDVSFAKTLIGDSSVAVVPGTAFGAESGSYIRISLATAPDHLYEGVSRIGETYMSFLG